MTNSIAPVWDGNETWLVLGGGGLMAVFPLAYATVLPALYMPDHPDAARADLPRRRVRVPLRAPSAGGRCGTAALPAARLIAALMQGIALGALVQGIEIADRQYAGGWWDWLTPFSILTGVARRRRLRAARRDLAQSQDQRRAAGESAALRHAGRRRHPGDDRRGEPVDAVPRADLFRPAGSSGRRRFSRHWCPLLVAVCAFGLWQGLTTDKHLQPFLAALGLFVLSFAGIGISFYPYIVPGALDHQRGGGARCLARLPAGRRSGAGPDHPGLHGLRLLGVPRQGRSRGGLPLMRTTAIRLAWFVGMWLAGVLAVWAFVAYGIRLMIT